MGAALTLAVVALSSSGSAPSFRSKLLLDTTGSEGQAIGDLNADRRPDIVTADFDGVSVYLNQGHGAFSLKEYEPWAARSATIADLNGDQTPDLVVEADGVSILLNNGGGAFRRGRDYDLGPKAGLGGVGDVDRDGRPDLIVTHEDGSTISVWLNAGDGTFEAQSGRYAAGDLGAVSVGDVNGDGSADVVTTDHNTASVLLNNGDGTFATGQDYATGREPFAIAERDLNGDGRPELIVANFRDRSVSVLRNRGEGSFGPKRDYKVGAAPVGVAAGDLNSDQKPDLAVVTYADTVSTLLNNGGGRFQPKLDYVLPLESGYFLAIADLTGDGRADVAVKVHNSRNGDSFMAALISTPGLCNVQPVAGRWEGGVRVLMTVAEARRTLARAHCRVGRISRVHSNWVKKGRVVRQKPAFGGIARKEGFRVDLVVSLGPRR